MEAALRIILSDYTIIVQVENGVPVQVKVNGPDESLQQSVEEKFMSFFPTRDGRLLMARLAFAGDVNCYEQALNELIEVLGVPPARR